MTITENKIEHLQTKAKAMPNKKKVNTSIPFQLKVVRWGFNTLGRVFPDKASQYALQFFSTPRIRARHKFSDELIDSAKRSEVQVAGNNIKTYEWGDGEKTVLLAHGWESRGTALRAYVPKLVTAGFRVLAFDAPAHGDSGGKQTNLHSFGEVVKAILLQNQPIHGIIAHSFGGPASMFALGNIDGGFPIPKIVMVACPSAISVPVNQAIKIMQLPKVVASKFVNRLEKALQRPIKEVSIPLFADGINVEEMLIVHDIHDKDVPIDSAIANAKAFKQAQLITTEGLGHSMILKDKIVIERIANFICR